MHKLVLRLYPLLFERVARPLIFRLPPMQAHEATMRALGWADGQAWAQTLARWAHDLAFVEQPISVGGARLRHPLILAAGFVKGEGFADEAAAQAAQNRNIIPGWRTIPAFVGAVEFGSFTRYPRVGNSGGVLWRDEAAHSLQNRVGLRNPGAVAAAGFLAARKRQLPRVFGINLATSPGVSDLDQQRRELLEALDAFRNRGVLPAWFTLNLSCPNTEDDPGSRQTEAQARDLCAALTAALESAAIPLWVKISPGLSGDQYRVLLRVFHETGVRAVIATNTRPEPAPDGATAGVSGGRLRDDALAAVRVLRAETVRAGYNLDIIACGGIEDGASFRAYAALGVRAMQYWSALTYRGPLAAALIEEESYL